MAKVKNINKVTRQIQNVIKGALTAKDLRPIADDFVKTIQSGRLLTGKGIKPLKSSTIKQRRRLSKVNPTDSNYSPAKSNLTFTGRFLKSFTATFKSSRDKIFLTIEPKGIHKGYNKTKGGRGKGTTNQKIGQGQIKMGRDFTKVGKKKEKEIAKLITRLIRRAFKNI